MSDANASAAPGARRDRHGMTVGRTASFADGLFGISMTILVLSINQPRGSTAAELWSSIRAMGPELFSYALSFAVIGRYWIGHHVLMQSVRRVTVPFLVFTLTFMCIVAFVSIPTEVMGEADVQSGAYTVAIIFYAASLGLLGFSFALLDWYALRNELIYPEEVANIRTALPGALVAPAVFWCSIPVAVLFGGAVASISWLLIIPLSFVTRKRFGRTQRQEQAT